MASIADVLAVQYKNGVVGMQSRLLGVMSMCCMSAGIVGVLLAVASWRATSRREIFVRFHAGVLLLWWQLNTNRMRFEVGSPKLAWLQVPFLGPVRTTCDVLVHLACIVLAITILLRLGFRRWSVQALSLCLAYLAVFDPLFIADFFIAPVVLSFFWCCLPADKGGLAGLQLQMVFLMFGAGFSKVGPHFDRPTVAHLAALLASVAPPWLSDLLWRGPEDLRPSGLASAVAAVTVVAEMAAPFFLFSSSKTIIKIAVLALTLMHAVMALCAVALTFLEVWMVLMWCYLFLGGHREGPSHGFDYTGLKAMPRLVKVGACVFFVIVMCAQLQPSMDWHPLFKYNHFASGNQPTDNPVLVRKAAVAKLRAQVPFPWTELDGGSTSGDAFMLAARWLLELNYKPAAALLDCAFVLAGGSNASEYLVTFEGAFTKTVAGGESGSMNNYNLHFFRNLAKMGFLDPGDLLLVWMEPIAWPQLPLGKQVMTWSIWDGKLGLVLRGEMTASQLRSVQKPSAAANFLPAECLSRASHQ